MCIQPCVGVVFVFALIVVATISTRTNARQDAHAPLFGILTQFLTGFDPTVYITEESPKDQAVKLVVDHVIHTALYIFKKGLRLFAVSCSTSHTGHRVGKIPFSAPIHSIIPIPKPAVLECWDFSVIHRSKPNTLSRLFKLPVHQVTYPIDGSNTPATS